MHKTFIFDMDGTLVHTAPEYRYKTVGQTLEKLGINAEKEAIDKFWFGSDRDKIIKDDLKANVKEFWEIFTSIDTNKSRSQYTYPYNDVNFLERLKGRKTGLVSCAPEDIIYMNLDKIGRNYFQAVVIARHSHGFLPKPHPGSLYKCMDLLESKKEDTIYIGNGEEDVEAAKKAGILDIWIDRKEHQFINIKPTITINSLFELEQFL